MTEVVVKVVIASFYNRGLLRFVCLDYVRKWWKMLITVSLKPKLASSNVLLCPPPTNRPIAAALESYESFWQLKQPFKSRNNPSLSVFTYTEIPHFLVISNPASKSECTRRQCDVLIFLPVLVVSIFTTWLFIDHSYFRWDDRLWRWVTSTGT